MESTHSQFEDKFEPKEFLRGFFDKLNILFTVIVFALIATYVGLKFATPLYEAQVKILITPQRQIETPYYKDVTYSRDTDTVMTQSEIVKSKAVLERTVYALKLDEHIAHIDQYNSSIMNIALKAENHIDSLVFGIKSFVYENLFGRHITKKRTSNFQKAVDFLRKHIAVKRVIDTDVFTIQVTDYDPVMAKRIANTLSRSYILFNLEQQLVEARLQYGGKHPMVRQLEDNIAEIQSSLSNEISDFDAIGPASVKIIEQAVEPQQPVSPRKALIYLLSLIISVLLGLFLIVFYGYIDQAFKSPKDLEDYLGIPFLGSLPLIKKDLRSFSKGELTEHKTLDKTLRILSDQFYLMIFDKKIKTVLMTSVDAKEGVSSVVLNLAKITSRSHGSKILVVDCNLRWDKDISNNHEEISGLASILEKSAVLDKCIKKMDENLYFLPAGQTQLNPLILLKSSKMQDLIKDLKGKFDLVLFDTSYLKDYQDAYVISHYVDAVVLVIDIERAKRPVVKNFVDMFADKDKIIGAIFNKRRYSIPEKIYKHI